MPLGNGISSRADKKVAAIAGKARRLPARVIPIDLTRYRGDLKMLSMVSLPLGISDRVPFNLTKGCF
jgi:hypothetical protein